MLYRVKLNVPKKVLRISFTILSFLNEIATAYQQLPFFKRSEQLPHLTKYTISQLQKSHSESLSPPARTSRQGTLAGRGGGSSAGGGNSINSSGGNLPISDNNVSTTAGDGVSDPPAVDWTDVGETDDINMAVAAAIGVGSGGGGGSDDLGNVEGRPSPRPSSNRIIGQKQNVVAASSAASGTSHLGEINRSIEKMSLSGGSSGGGGCLPTTAATTSSPKAVVAVPPGAGANRRDSNWTSVSTEGYGSMRSSEGGGCSGGGGGGGRGGGIRRYSEQSVMSQASNLSTRANVNSPWDPISVGSSRRSSVAEVGGGAAVAVTSIGGSAGAISHHIDRLRRRAQQKGAAAPQTASTTSRAAAAVVADGRQSAMSDCTVESQQQSNFAAPRRASDPVRTLDRNFGVGGQMGSQARHGSCNHLDKQRPPPNGVLADSTRLQVSSYH